MMYLVLRDIGKEEGLVGGRERFEGRGRARIKASPPALPHAAPCPGEPPLLMLLTSRVFTQPLKAGWPALDPESLCRP